MPFKADLASAGRVPILVSDVEEVLRGTADTAQAAGLMVLEVRGTRRLPVVSLKVATAEAFLAAAKGLHAAAIYLEWADPPRDEMNAGLADLVSHYADPTTGHGADELGPLRRGLERFEALIRDGRPFDGGLAFVHDGIYHSARVVDQACWPLISTYEVSTDDASKEEVRRLLGLEADRTLEEYGMGETGVEDEAAEADLHPDLRSADPRDVAHAIIGTLKAGGASRREMRRGSADLVRQAIDEMYPGREALGELERRHLAEARRIAERRLRKGDF